MLTDEQKAYNKKDAQLRNNYGITLADYDAMYEEQVGRCAICHTKEPEAKKGRFAVDHCHSTGEIRGLLCFNCNIGIGKFKDNALLLANAIKYLALHTRNS